MPLLAAQPDSHFDETVDREPGVEPAVGKRWALSPHQGFAPTLGEDRPEHFRGSIECVRTCREVGTGHEQPRVAKRAASTEEAEGHCTHASTANANLPECFWAVVPGGVPRNLSSDWGTPWRDPGASVVRHSGWPRIDRAIAHANQTGAGVQGSEDGRQRSRDKPTDFRPPCPRYPTQAARGIPQTVWSRLPGGFGFDLRESRRYAIKA